MLIPLDLPPGINSDDTTFSAKGRWADGNNIRFVAGRPQVIGYSAATSVSLGGPVYNMFALDRSGVTWIAYARASAIYVGQGIAAPTARTPVGMASAAAFAFAAWGQQFLFAPSGGTLYEQTGTSTATEITQAQDKIRWMLVTPERQVLALGTNEESSGTFNPLCIRGSDLEDYTDWTTSATNNAFEHILEGGSSIVAGRMVGPYVAVWTDTSLYLGQFIGDPGQAYRFDRVGGNCGLLAPNAVAVVGNTAYWLGQDLRLRRWTPGAETQVIPCSILREFSDSTQTAGIGPDFGDRALTALVYVSKFNEIRIYYRSDTNSNGRFIAVCLDDMAWHKGDANRYSALCDDLLFSALGNTYATNLIDADGNGAVYAVESVGGTIPASWYIQSADQYLDKSQQRLMIRSVQPDFEAQDGGTNDNAVSLTLYVRDRPQSTAVTKGPYSIAAGANKKDFRASGKIIAARFSQSTVDRELRIGRPVFDAVPLGER